MLIVGAGPTGLSLSIELTRHGVPHRLIDKVASPARESRALGIQPRTLEMFHGMGVIDEFLARGLRVKGAHLHSGGSTIARISVESLATPYPFILSIPQNETEQILGSHVRAERGVELLSFTDNGTGVTANLKHAAGATEEAQFIYIAGCDGAHSTVRKASSIDFEGAQFPQAFLLADVRIDWDAPSDEFQLYFHPEGLFATFGFGNDRYRIIASDPPAGTPTEPTLEEVQKIAAVRVPQGMRLSDPRWITTFHVHHRMVSTFRKGRVFLLGDAAHIHSPAGGQGMNTGIQDACNLAWKIALVHSGASDPQLLDSYDAERRPVARAVIDATTFLTRMAAAHNRLLEYLRDHLAPAIASAARGTIAQTLSQLSVNYRDSPIVEDHHVSGHGPHAGDRWPEPLTGPGHKLLLPGDAELGDRLASYLPYLSIRESPSIYLVRPDQHVAYRGPADALIRYLQRLLPGAEKLAALNAR